MGKFFGGKSMDSQLFVRHHRVPEPAALIEWYDREVRRGPTYFAYRPTTPSDTLLLEDLGLAVLLEGRPQSRAAMSLALLDDEQRDLRAVPKTALHLSTPDDRQAILQAIVDLVSLPGFASSLATKVLHKKRPATVPILDNRAIYGTLLSDTWIPGKKPTSNSVRRGQTIALALETIYTIVSAPKNEPAFVELEKRFPDLTRIQLFDKVWWAFIRPKDS